MKKVLKDRIFVDHLEQREFNESQERGLLSLPTVNLDEQLKEATIRSHLLRAQEPSEGVTSRRVTSPSSYLFKQQRNSYHPPPSGPNHPDSVQSSRFTGAAASNGFELLDTSIPPSAFQSSLLPPEVRRLAESSNYPHFHQRSPPIAAAPLVAPPCSELRSAFTSFGFNPTSATRRIYEEIIKESYREFSANGNHPGSTNGSSHSHNGSFNATQPANNNNNCVAPEPRAAYHPSSVAYLDQQLIFPSTTHVQSSLPISRPPEDTGLISSGYISVSCSQPVSPGTLNRFHRAGSPPTGNNYWSSKTAFYDYLSCISNNNNNTSYNNHLNVTSTTNHLNKLTGLVATARPLPEPAGVISDPSDPYRQSTAARRAAAPLGASMAATQYSSNTTAVAGSIQQKQHTAREDNHHNHHYHLNHPGGRFYHPYSPHTRTNLVGGSSSTNFPANPDHTHLDPQLLGLGLPPGQDTQRLLERLGPHMLRSHMSTVQYKPIPCDEKTDLQAFERKPVENWGVDEVIGWMIEVGKRHSVPVEDLSIHRFADCTGPLLMLMNYQNFVDRDTTHGALLFLEFKKLFTAQPTPPPPTSMVPVPATQNTTPIAPSSTPAGCFMPPSSTYNNSQIHPADVVRDTSSESLLSIVTNEQHSGQSHSACSVAGSLSSFANSSVSMVSPIAKPTPLRRSSIIVVNDTSSMVKQECMSSPDWFKLMSPDSQGIDNVTQGSTSPEIPQSLKSPIHQPGGPPVPASGPLHTASSAFTTVTKVNSGYFPIDSSTLVANVETNQSAPSTMMSPSSVVKLEQSGCMFPQRLSKNMSIHGVVKKKPGRKPGSVLKALREPTMKNKDKEAKKAAKAANLAAGILPRPRKRSQHVRGNKLWEFIRDALKDPSTCPSVVKWEDPVEGVFRIVESEKLARLWGQKKNNQKMTYEKLSRAMRTYYEKLILVPVPKTGLYPKKLVYKFGPNAHGWGPNAGPAKIIAPNNIATNNSSNVASSVNPAVVKDGFAPKSAQNPAISEDTNNHAVNCNGMEETDSDEGEVEEGELEEGEVDEEEFEDKATIDHPQWYNDEQHHSELPAFTLSSSSFSSSTAEPQLFEVGGIKRPKLEKSISSYIDTGDIKQEDVYNDSSYGGGSHQIISMEESSLTDLAGKQNFRSDVIGGNSTKNGKRRSAVISADIDALSPSTSDPTAEESPASTTLIFEKFLQKAQSILPSSTENTNNYTGRNLDNQGSKTSASSTPTAPTTITASSIAPTAYGHQSMLIDDNDNASFINVQKTNPQSPLTFRFKLKKESSDVITITQTGNGSHAHQPPDVALVSNSSSLSSIDPSANHNKSNLNTRCSLIRESANDDSLTVSCHSSSSAQIIINEESSFTDYDDDDKCDDKSRTIKEKINKQSSSHDDHVNNHHQAANAANLHKSVVSMTSSHPELDLCKYEEITPDTSPQSQTQTSQVNNTSSINAPHNNSNNCTGSFNGKFQGHNDGTINQITTNPGNGSFYGSSLEIEDYSPTGLL